MHVQKMFNLKGKSALVTGGARLYGSCISQALGEAGASVIIASRDIKKCQAKAKELQEQGLDIYGELLDITDEESVVELKERIVSKYGKIDIMVNSARLVSMLSFEDPIERWEESMKVNSTGIFLCTRIFIEQMKKQRHGNIINIGSIYGIVGQDPELYAGTDMKSAPDYWFCKGGIINLTKYLATKFASYNIRVNCISPGGLITKDTPSQFIKNYSHRVPLGRMANEDDIKGAVVYLASDASAYVTGHNLVVDGGWTVW